MTLLAHGLGGSTDLSVPLGYALVGAAWALTFTFAVVALAWRKLRLDPAEPGHPLPDWVTRVVDATPRAMVAVLALTFTVWVLAAGVFRPQNNTNALPGAFHVLLRVGLVAVSLAVGPAWRVISPMRTIYRISLGTLSFRHPGYPSRLGSFLAAFGLFAFAWLELASPSPGSPAAIMLWLLVYATAFALGAALWGDRWFARPDPFEQYSVVASRLSLFRRNRNTGRIVAGNPLDHPAVAAHPPGDRHRIGGAARIDGVLQLLGHPRMAQFRR